MSEKEFKEDLKGQLSRLETMRKHDLGLVYLGLIVIAWSFFWGVYRASEGGWLVCVVMLLLGIANCITTRMTILRMCDVSEDIGRMNQMVETLDKLDSLENKSSV